MAESRYEKYIVREPTRAQHGVSLSAWATVPDSRTAPPFMFLEGEKPIKGINHMVEFMWIWKDTAMGATTEKPPHKHDCDEIFLFLGTNKDDPNDLGAEIDFWLGEGEEADKLTFGASSLVYVPANLLHLPIIYKNVKKPLLLVVTAINAGDLKVQTIKYPVRKISAQ